MAAWALRQRGNVTRRQLLDAGFAGNVIDDRIRRGSLHVQFPGVYLVGHRAQPALARECAALLHCAPRALLSHGTAARLWKLPVPRCHDIEVTLVGRQRPSRPGLRIFSIQSIAPYELRRHEGLPLTSPSLTLLDIAGQVRERELADALNEARVQKIVNDGEIHRTLAAHRNRRGARALRKLFDAADARFATESRTERLCLRLMIEHGLEPDETQVWIGPYRVDFLYRPERLVVEADSYQFHGTKKRFVEDRRRTAYLIAGGYEVFPLTWWDLTEQPEASMSRLRRAREARRELLGLPALRA
jgi:very-short-patch-repair endonuclease